MTDYPSRENANADKAARRRGLTALRSIAEDATALERRIEAGYEPYGEDAQRLADNAVKVAVQFSALETLRDAREWHEADQVELAGAKARAAGVLDLIVKHGDTDGADHKQWVLDQAARELSGGAVHLADEGTIP
jgi:hypothetical protein